MQHKFIFALILFLFKRASSIIGGDPQNHDQFKYHAKLFHQPANDAQRIFKCNGAVVHSDLVLTAKRCNLAANQTVIILSDDTVMGVVKTLPVNEDLVLLELDSPVEDTERIIKLATMNTKGNTKNCWMSGFGSLDANVEKPSNELHVVNLTIFGAKSCEAVLERNLSSEMLCAGLAGKGGCHGDIGAPLACKSFLVGIAITDHGCGQKGRHTVFANVFQVKREIVRFFEGNRDEVVSEMKKQEAEEKVTSSGGYLKTQLTLIILLFALFWVQ